MARRYPPDATRNSLQRGLLLLIVLMVTAAGVITSGVPAFGQGGARSADWAAVNCREFKLKSIRDNVECGYVTVPLKHADPAGAKIQLATVIIRNEATDRRPDPLFIAQGGPGGSTIEAFADGLIGIPKLRPTTDRDIVLWDQRGTLFSKPALLCPEVAEAQRQAAFAPTPPADSSQSVAAYRACEDRLASEAGDLSAFNSAENANDVERLRQALGYDQINFYGVSYGTELGQFLMRQHPQRLRSVILDAVVPLTLNLFTEPAFAQQRIAERYFNQCAAEPRCNAAFPNLGPRFLALLVRLDAQPVTVTVTPLNGLAQRYQVRLNGTLLASALYQGLYADVNQLVPLIVDRADKGDYTLVSSLLLPLFLFQDSFATGMYLTVACAERGDTDPSAVDYSRLARRVAQSSRADAASLLALCKDWNIALLPRTALAPVQSDIPTLLLSGEFDPITPPEYAATLLPTLPNARHVIFPAGEHGQAFASACANGIIQRFLDDPNAPVEAACATEPPTRFYTEADLITIPALKRALDSGGVPDLLFGIGREVYPGVLALAFLLTAFPVYALTGLVGLVRRRPAAPGRPAWVARWSRIAPWLPLSAAILLLVFFLGVAAAVAGALDENQFLLGLAAIPERSRWLFFLPLLIVLVVAAMLVAAFVLWTRGTRSVVDRIYFSLLTIAGLIAVANLFSLGVMGLWRG